MFLKITCYVLLFLSCPVLINAQTSGGTFNITHSVTASGGETMTGAGGFKMDGTIAQPGVGFEMTDPPFALTSGFWNPLFAPTAAGASIGGRVVGMEGEGVGGVNVSLNGGLLVAPRTTRTNRMGYFTFEDVEVGHFYIVAVFYKRFGFAQSTREFTLFENITDIVFQASWENKSNER